jgi:hypothetical protein
MPKKEMAKNYSIVEKLQKKENDGGANKAMQYYKT